MNERIKQLAEKATQEFSSAFERDKWLEKFAELLVQDYAKHLVQANMSNHWYVQAMDAYYESKWAHRFD